MSDRRTEQQRAVCEALAACAERIDARIDDGWLHLSAPARRRLPGAAAACLRRNAELGGGVKFATGAAALELRAEIPLDLEPLLLRRRIAETCAAFAQVPSRLAGEGQDGGPLAAALHAPPLPDLLPHGGKEFDLRCLLVESGWSVNERADGSLSVDLGVPDAFFQAEIEVRGGMTCVAVALAAVGDAPTVCREAVALLLLRAAAVLRMARPVLAADGAPRFEVVLAGAPGAGEVGHALSVLTVACRLFGREVEVLQRSERLAARYCAAHAGLEADGIRAA